MKTKKKKIIKSTIPEYKFSYRKEIEERDMTADEWLDSWGSGETYGEMNPRDILEGNVKSCIMEIDSKLQFTDHINKENLLLTISGQLNMMKNWFYILHCYDIGDKITQHELEEK